MNNLKMLALIGVAATSVTAHDFAQDDILHQKVQFLRTCSPEVRMCEKIIACKHDKDSVIVDPSGSTSGGDDPVPSDDISIARQCIEKDLAVCLPALDTKDPIAFSQCVIANKKAIFAKLKHSSDECTQAFQDLLHIHGKNRRHGHHGHHSPDKHSPNKPSPDQDSSDKDFRLSAPGADIGACLLENTANLTAPCLSAVENVSGDWAFLDVEMEQRGDWWSKHKARFPYHVGFIVFAVVVMLCCCVRRYRKRKENGGCTRGRGRCSNAGSAMRPVTLARPMACASPTVVQSPYISQTVPDSEQAQLDRAIAESLAESRPSAPPAAVYQPPRLVDVTYTGDANREPMLQAGLTHSDQYV